MGLPFRSNAYTREVERCIDTIPNSKQGFAVKFGRKFFVAEFEDALKRYLSKYSGNFSTAQLNMIDG